MQGTPAPADPPYLDVQVYGLDAKLTQECFLTFEQLGNIGFDDPDPNGTTTGVHGLSLYKLVTNQLVDSARAQYGLVTGPTGTATLPDPHDFDAPGGSSYPYVGSQPVFFSANDAGTGNPQIHSLTYSQPYSAAADGASLQSNDDSGGLQVQLHTSGTLLTPTISGPTSAKVGGSVTFTASVQNPPAGLKWIWSTGGPSTVTKVSSPPPSPLASSSAAEFSYTTAGFWTPSVTVTAVDGSTGGARAEGITVTPAKPSSPPSKPSSPATTGPSHGNGGSRNPETGPATASTSLTGGGATATGRPTPGGTSGAPVSGGVPSGPGSASRSGAGGAASSASSGRNGSVPSGALVAGYALDVQAAGAQPASVGASTAAPAPAARGSVRVERIGLGVLAGFGILCLLALGVGAELRRPLRTARRRA